MSVCRRGFLAGLLATAACGGGSDRAEPDGPGTTGAPPPTEPELPADVAGVVLASDPFTLGVASGDPDPTSVVLWTRLAPDPLAAGAGVPADATAVAVEVTPTEDFRDTVVAGRFPVDAERAHAVHAVVDGLEPATTYRYRFRIGTWTSPVGTTRTAPAPDDAAPLRAATASCQRYDHGFYAAHRSIAGADLDLVVFLGDYVYESPTAGDAVRSLPGPLGTTEATDLDGYRLRYAAARLDPDLAAAHAAHPWVVVWDDHEVQNNHAGGGGTLDRARQAAAYQAWWEHQPVRLPPPGAGEAFPIHRAVRWGSTVDLVALDTRQFRSAEACGGGVVPASCADRARPERTMLGDAQADWLDERLAAADTTWTALAQSVVFAPVEVLDVVNADAWDGYTASRQRLLDALAAHDVRNTVVLTGDVHVALVADVPGADGRPVATELVTPSISSRSSDQYGPLVGLLPTVAPQVVHAADHRGWLEHTVSSDGWTARFHEVEDPTRADSAVTPGATFTIAEGTPGARRA